jgi:hypothetical protein
MMTFARKTAWSGVRGNVVRTCGKDAARRNVQLDYEELI